MNKPNKPTAMTEQSVVMVLHKPHRYRNRITGYYYHGAEIDDPVLLIDYVDGRPHSILTAWDCWDVDWCKRDQRLCFHLSGGQCYLDWREHNNGYYKDHGSDEYHKSDKHGQSVEFFGMVELDLKYTHDTVWVNREFVRPINDAGKTLLDSPMALGGGVVNPFLLEDFTSWSDSPTVYCTECDDHIPDDDLCDHLDWCDEHGTHKGSTHDGCGCKG